MLAVALALQPVLAAAQDAFLAWLIGSQVLVPVIRSEHRLAFRKRERQALWGLIWALSLFLLNGSYLMTESSWSRMPEAVWLVLCHSSFGRTVGLGLLLGLIWLVAQRKDRPVGPVSSWLAFCLMAYARAATGHAADHGILSIAVFMHAIHILAAGVWAGSVWVAAFLAPRWRHLPWEDARAWAPALSRAATWAVPVLIMTGLWDGWRTLGPADHWGGTAYVPLLLAKLLLVALAIALGLRNRWHWMPRLTRNEDGAIHGFGRVLSAEAIVLLAVMGLAGELGQAMLPG